VKGEDELSVICIQAAYLCLDNPTTVPW